VLKLWNSGTGQLQETPEKLGAPATYLGWSRDGRCIAATGYARDGAARWREVKVWDASSGAVLFAFTPAPGPLRFVHGRVALSPDGSLVAFDDYEDAEIDAATGEPTGQPQTVLRVHVVRTGRELWRERLGPSVLYCLAFSPDGQALAYGVQAGDLWMSDTLSGSHRWQNSLPASIFRLAFAPDGRRLAGADREVVRVFETRDGQELLILRGAPQRPFDGGFNPCLAWSLDGRRLASLNWDQSISVWDASEASPAPADRWRTATSRVFDWHLAECTAALGGSHWEAAEFHLAALRGLEAPDSTSLRRRAHLLLRMGSEIAARGDYDRWLATSDPDRGEAWLGRARLFLLEGDQNGYRRLCTRMLDAFEREPQDSEAYHAARVLGLGPCSASDANRLIKLIQPERVRRVGRPFDFLGAALAHFRASQWEQARAALEEWTKREPQGSYLASPLRAMIHHHLGQAADARGELAEARIRLEQHRKEEQAAGRRLFDGEWFDCEVYYLEAAASIGAGAK
jgi:tetratricopeptide (TPR) repeat protein